MLHKFRRGGTEKTPVRLSLTLEPDDFHPLLISELLGGANWRSEQTTAFKVERVRLRS